jgi:hypothetical protein
MTTWQSARSPSRELLQASLTHVRRVADLASAEVRLAAVSSLNMLLLILLSAGALMIAWGLVVVCGLYIANSFGAPWPWTALVFAGIHAVLAGYLWHAAIKLSGDLTLPELRKTLASYDRRLREVENDRDASPGEDRQATPPARAA